MHAPLTLTSLTLPLCPTAPTTPQKAKKSARQKRQKEAEKAEQLGEEPVRKAPRTIENTREKDETMVQPDDAEVQADEQQDEFAGARCSWPLACLCRWNRTRRAGRTSLWCGRARGRARGLQQRVGCGSGRTCGAPPPRHSRELHQQGPVV